MPLYPSNLNHYLPVKDELSRWMIYVTIFGMGVFIGIFIAGVVG